MRTSAAKPDRLVKPPASRYGVYDPVLPILRVFLESLANLLRVTLFGPAYIEA